MSTVLHISDLHLLPRGADDATGDYKDSFVPVVHRQLRQDLLFDTLRGLRAKLTAEGKELDAVVVSGDVTNHGKRSGLELLSVLLGELGDKLPPSERIVVVPGNHDVAYRSAPSSLERYKDFVDVVRGLGYVTPVLEGVDAIGSSLGALVLDDVIICAVNSADYAGALRPVEDKVKAQLSALRDARHPPAELLKAFEESRLVDAARINAVQMRHVAEQLAELDPNHRRVRVVTFHHQLRPVTTSEELKPYEAFSNLAEIEAFLRASEVDVVLHGHKHASALQRLEIASLAAPDAPTHPCWVVSAGTVGGVTGAGHEAAKLLNIEAPYPRTRVLTVQSIPALSTGGRLEELVGQRAVIASPASVVAGPRQLNGRTVSDVHEQLIADVTLRSGDGPLVCVIERPSSDEHVPETYPTVTATKDLDAWFRGQVDWWQSHDVAKDKPFTHGDYIRRWRGVEDQLARVVATLKVSPASSRALITLFDPDQQEQAFPSFAVLHFKLREGMLEAFAFFRKQEMRYWWTINVTEIAVLQNEVVAALTRPGRPVKVGRIMTVSAEAVFSDVLPKVAVPVLDQYAWGGPAEIARMAAAVYDQAMPHRVEVLMTACEHLEELAPPEVMPQDGPYVSVAGPEKLYQLLVSLGESYPSPGKAVTEFIAKLDAFVDKQRNGQRLEDGDRPSDYSSWAAASRAQVNALIVSLRALAEA